MKASYSMVLATFSTSFWSRLRIVLATNSTSLEMYGKRPLWFFRRSHATDTEETWNTLSTWWEDDALESIDRSSDETLFEWELSETTMAELFRSDAALAVETILFFGGSELLTDCFSRVFWHSICVESSGWSRRNRGWWKAPVSGPRVACRKPLKMKEIV